MRRIANNAIRAFSQGGSECGNSVVALVSAWAEAGVELGRVSVIHATPWWCPQTRLLVIDSQ